MDEDNIRQLLDEATKIVNINEVYDKCTQQLDIEAICSNLKNGSLTFKEYAANYAYTGFLNGIEFALRNIIGQEEA